MARLTRTQKFADLREQLANDKETSVNTQDLSQYQNRLNNIQDTLVPNSERVVPQEKEYTWNEFSDANQAPAVQTPVNNVLDYQQAPVEQSVQETYQEPVEQPVEEVVEDVVEEISTEEVEPQNDGLMDINDFIYDAVDQTNTDEVKVVDEEPNLSVDDIYADVFEDVEDTEAKEVTKKERDTYLDQTLSDVRSQNVNSGLKTIEEIIEENVNEVRHQKPVEKSSAIEITPTVWTKAENKPVQETVRPIETLRPLGETKPVEQVKPEVKPVEQVKPVATPVKVQPEKDVVEIKNIDELEEKPNFKDTMSETIPFVVTDDNDNDIEEEEEEGSNVVLNVILIVLIIILVAVLGLIVFYILKTKGIL